MIKKFFSKYLLLVIPLTVLAFSLLLRTASGPFYLFADPCYIYLFNGLCIVKGHPPVDLWHPGTPLQTLISLVVWIFNIGRPVADTVGNVLINPEFYLHAVYFLLLLSSFLSSIYLAMYVYRKTNDKIASLLVQLPALTFLILPSFNSSVPTIPIVANVSPEPFFITIMNLFNLFFLRSYFSNTAQEELKNNLFLAFICGLGLAIKLNFLPVFICALILVSWRTKPLFILVCLGSFVLWTLPIIQKYSVILDKIKMMVFYADKYGQGAHTIIDKQLYAHYFGFLFQQHFFFILTAAILLVTSLFGLLKNKKDRSLRFLSIASAGVLLQYLFTAKYFSFHYLVPGIGLCSSAFLLFYLKQKGRYKQFKWISIAFILAYIFVCIFIAIGYQNKLGALTKDILAIKERVARNYPNCTVISTNTADVHLYLTKEHALFVGNDEIEYGLSEELYQIYPHQYYFFSEEITRKEGQSYGIWDFKKRIYGDELLSTSPCSIFLKYGSDFSQFPYQVRLIDSSKFLNAYLLLGSTEKEANELFQIAQVSFNERDYRKAFILGVRSLQLNYEPRGQIEYFLAMTQHQLQAK